MEADEMYIAYDLFIPHPVWESSVHMLGPTQELCVFSLYLACERPPQQQSAHPSGTDFLLQSFHLSPESFG